MNWSWFISSVPPASYLWRTSLCSVTSSLVSAPPNILFKIFMFDILGPEIDVGAGGSSGRNLGSGTPRDDGEHGSEERLVGVDGVGEVRGDADGLAGEVGRGLEDGEALDGVELGEDVLEHSPLRKAVILVPAIA